MNILGSQIQYSYVVFVPILLRLVGMLCPGDEVLLSSLFCPHRLDVLYSDILNRKKLLFVGHFNFNKNNIQTAVTTMTKQRML